MRIEMHIGGHDLMRRGCCTSNAFIQMITQGGNTGGTIGVCHARLVLLLHLEDVVYHVEFWSRQVCGPCAERSCYFYDEQSEQRLMVRTRAARNSEDPRYRARHAVTRMLFERRDGSDYHLTMVQLQNLLHTW